MASVNKVIIVGNLGRDPEVRYTPNGSAVCNVSVATTRSWKNKDSRRQGRRDRMAPRRLLRPLAEIAGEYLKKGRSVYVEGRLKTRKWQDKDGVEKYTTEIVADRHADARQPRRHGRRRGERRTAAATSARRQAARAGGAAASRPGRRSRRPASTTWTTTFRSDRLDRAARRSSARRGSGSPRASRPAARDVPTRRGGARAPGRPARPTAPSRTAASRTDADCPAWSAGSRRAARSWTRLAGGVHRDRAIAGERRVRAARRPRRARRGRPRSGSCRAWRRPRSAPPRRRRRGWRDAARRRRRGSCLQVRGHRREVGRRSGTASRARRLRPSAPAPSRAPRRRS